MELHIERMMNNYRQEYWAVYSFGKIQQPLILLSEHEVNRLLEEIKNQRKEAGSARKK